MKLIDRYVITKFITTFLFAILLFTVISIVIDITEKLDDFLDNKIPLSAIAFDYYLNFIPWITAMLMPLFIFITVIFFTSKMAYNSEIIAMLGNGINFYRLLRPYIISSVIFAGLLLYLNHYLVPLSNMKRLEFENVYILKGYNRGLAQNIHMRLSTNEYIYMENYNRTENEGFKFSYERFKEGALIEKIKAERIEWNYTAKNWSLYNAVVRQTNGMIEHITKSEKLVKAYNFKPDDFNDKEFVKEALTTPQLDKVIADQQMRGADNLESYYVEKYRRTAAPFSIIILSIMGVAVASRKVRGGMGFHIAFGLALSALYILFMQMSSTFANQAGLNPYLGVWIPNILFSIVAIVLIIRAQK